MFWGRVTEVSLSVITLTVALILYKLSSATAGDAYHIGKSALAMQLGTGGRDQVELTGGGPPSSRNRAAPSPCLLPLGAARQTAFMCARAQSAKFVNPLGTRALAAATSRIGRICRMPSTIGKQSKIRAEPLSVSKVVSKTAVLWI